MVIGLEHLRAHFAPYQDQFAIIGGTACDCQMKRAGAPFRATRDIDLVLFFEQINASFVRAVWSFIRAGQYTRQEATSGRRTLYRFSHPETSGFPAMLELFSRLPDGIEPGSRHLTPIHIDDHVSPLSAILLDDDYYQWIIHGTTIIDDLPMVRPEHLIPLKARAWIDLSKRRANGERIDSRDIRKHRNDVVRLFAIVDPTYACPTSAKIRHDMREFIAALHNEPIDPGQFGLPGVSASVVMHGLHQQFVGQM